MGEALLPTMAPLVVSRAKAHVRWQHCFGLLVSAFCFGWVGLLVKGFFTSTFGELTEETTLCLAWSLLFLFWVFLEALFCGTILGQITHERDYIIPLFEKHMEIHDRKENADDDAIEIYEAFLEAIKEGRVTVDVSKDAFKC